jgi:nucleoside-diphosphate-sugar epimerase
MSRVFITGACGYTASVLIPSLVFAGHEVTGYDILYFGKEHLTGLPNLKIIEGDIRDTAKLEEACKEHDIFINLACITNDASFELDDALSISINYDAFEPMVLAAKRSGIKRFIHASTSSVYGVSDAPDVFEDHPLVPLTLYNKYKGLVEPILFKHTDADFVGVIFRPATVCGYAPRLRLDLSVNILTCHACMKDKITVFGGSQLRPNLHVKDYAEVVKLLMTAPTEKIANQIFNVGFQNMSILQIAELVKKVVEGEYTKYGVKKNVEIEVKSSDDDIRSYHINSDKIKNALGFVPQFSVEDAIRGLAKEFRRFEVPNCLEDDIYYPVRRLKRINAL